jgi:acyl carrier protein
VPVAVLALKLKDCERADLVQSIQQQIKVRFGNTHRLRHVLTLNDLELAQYPTTATGKVKKGVLRDAVEDFLGGNKVTVSKPTGTLDAILTIWKELLAAGNSDITPQLSVTTLADSLMMLRFCFEVEQRLGKRMTIAEILKNVTPVAQARLLDSHANGTASIESSAATSKPVWEQQAQQSKEDNTLVTDRVRSAINECLQSIGACWPNDVEAVYEPHEGMDMSLSGNARSSSCNVRWAFEVTEESTTAEKIYESLAQVLERHAALRAVVVPLEKRCHPLRSIHVVLKANQKWLQHAVKVIEPVDRAENLMNIIDGGNMPFGGGLGQQALQACIVPLEGSDSGTRFGLCLSVCHAVFDAMSMTAFMKDLHSSLRQEPIPRTTPIPYMAFAEVYRIHKGSALGRRTAMYHANKFVSSKVPLSCLWPPSKGPGFFIGPDDGWKLDDGSPGQASDRVSSDATAGISRGRAVHSKAKIPGLQELKSEHSIEPSTVFKAAVALFNAEQTGGDRAVFKTTSAGRTWPFLEDWIAQSLPHALGIAGPCLTYSIDCIAIGRGQGVGELLRDVQASEEMDRSYPHAPWVSIREGLDEPVRKALDAVVRRQTFNWDPSTKARHATARPALKTLARLGFIDVGFWWNFGVVAEDEVAGFVLYDDVHLVNTQASDALARVFVLAQLLVEKDSWEKTLGQVLERRA